MGHQFLRRLAGVAFALSSFAVQAAGNVLVVSTGNSDSSTAGVASWLQASGDFASVTALDTNSVSYSMLSGYDEVLFFSNGSGDPSGTGDALASYAFTGKRLVVGTFSWAEQGSNTVGGNFISQGYSPFTAVGGSLYTYASMGSNDGTPLFQGVNTLTAYYRDHVVASSGATLNASYTDGVALVATKGNVIGVNVFPDDSYGNVSGDYRQLYINALAVPEPEGWGMLLAGLGLLGWLARRQGAGLAMRARSASPA